MNSGIYALYWWDQDLIYIGQSQNLNRRKLEHFKDLQTKKHSNYKVQDSYNKYGLPEFIILEYTNIINLNTQEIYWQKEFNSIYSLDIIKAGKVGYGTESNNSKYTKREVLKVFACLYSNKYNRSIDIVKRCNLPETAIWLVNEIYNSKCHLWLEYEYPEQYKVMKSINYKSKSRYGTLYRKYGNLISPDGTLFTIKECVLNTAKEIQIAYYPEDSEEVIRKGISRVLSGTRFSWRGWKLSNI